MRIDHSLGLKQEKLKIVNLEYFMQNQRAEQTIRLFKLDNIDQRGKVVDLRWQKRYEASLAVKSAFELYQSAKLSNSDAYKLIYDISKSIGFFDIWFDVFSNEPLVLGELVRQIAIHWLVSSPLHPLWYRTQLRLPVHIGGCDKNNKIKLDKLH